MIPLTPAQQQQFTLAAMEIALGDLTERDQVLATGEGCTLLRASLGMEVRAYWDASD